MVMDMSTVKVITLQLAVVVVLASVMGACSECKSSLEGREFIFGILMTSKVRYYYYHAYDVESSNYTIDLHVINASPDNSRIRLQIPYSSIDKYYSVPDGQSKTISVNPNILRNDTFTDRRGLKITSDYDIIVLVTIVHSFSNRSYIQSYNVLPSENAESRYTSFSGRYNFGMSALITGIYNNTLISVYNDTQRLNTTYLNSLDVYQVWTGYSNSLHVTADKGVTVVFATQIYRDTLFPYNSADEYTATSLIPVNKWSNSYIVPPITVTNAFQIRYFSEYKFLTVTLSNASATYTLTESHEKHLFGNETLVITAERTFSVIQNSYNVKAHITDNKFMAAVPGVDQYINDYRFTVPHLESGLPHSNLLIRTNYIVLIVPANGKDGLLIDGSPFQSMRNSSEEFSVPPPFNNYTVLSFQISEGYHRVYHPMTTFGLLVYGHQWSTIYGYNEWYGFYAGFHFKGDCFSTSKTEATTSSITSTSTIKATTNSISSTSTFEAITSSTPSTSKTEATTSSVPHGNTVSSGLNSTLMCYNCENLGHIDLCDKISRCAGNEMCFLERQNKFGRVTYRSGCLTADQCKHHHLNFLNDPCVECCNGSFCNNQGCGEIGLPDRAYRGPVCYDCQHVWFPDECTTVTLCSPEQVCRIEQFPWGDHFHYKMGCANSVCDPLKRSVHHLSKRATPVCHSCCNGDYCNNDCTRRADESMIPHIVG